MAPALALDDVSAWRSRRGSSSCCWGRRAAARPRLLNLIGGFAEPTAGQVLIGGRDMAGVAPKDRPTTTVFQDYALFPHMTLRDNVGFGLRMRGVDRAKRAAKADDDAGAGRP